MCFPFVEASVSLISGGRIERHPDGGIVVTSKVLPSLQVTSAQVAYFLPGTARGIAAKLGGFGWLGILRHRRMLQELRTAVAANAEYQFSKRQAALIEKLVRKAIKTGGGVDAQLSPRP